MKRTASRSAPTFCLTMIVKDEAHVVGETIAAMLPYVSEFVVVDTGSTDGTPRLIRETFDRHHVPGFVFERPWRDFGHNRSEALQLARVHSTADYLWMMDADDIVIGEPDLSALHCDGYRVRFGPDTEYWRPQIFKRCVPWRYVGVLHEYAACDAPGATLGDVQGDYYVRSRRLGSRNRRADKYAGDARTLAAALQTDPSNERNVFYLAQSYFDAGDIERALRCYVQRAAMGGWEQEVFYARFRQAQCLERLRRPLDEVLAAYVQCSREHPGRAEPLVEAARLARLAGDFTTAYEHARRAAEVPRPGTDALFVHAGTYDYRARDEQAIAAYHLGRHGEAFRLNQALLENPALPESERARIESNRDFSVPFVKDEYLRYDTELVRRLSQRPPVAQPRVTMSITTCKRLDLFVRTMTSFLNACADIDLIDRWICVDDNSSDADRVEMERLFPFFEFVLKGADEKGHARSMNLIRERVRTPFLVHLEDDWQFFVRRPYIGPAIEILEECPNVGQLLFNRNYAEVLDERRLPGGRLAVSWTHAHRFRIHEHYAPQSEEYRRFQDAHGRPSNAHWPHYSLRPSVLKTSVLQRIGAYAEDSPHFELDYAERYTGAGFRSGFFDGIHCLHIGRTWRHQEAGIANAYTLNDTVQFGPQPPSLGTRNARPCPDARADHDRIASCPGVPDCVVINLDRRPDRLQRFQQQAARCGLRGWRRFAAVDGQALRLTDEIRHLFRDNDHDYRCGIIGCALSHLHVWRTIERPTLILEDDAELAPWLVPEVQSALDQALRLDPAWDLILLGFHRWTDQEQQLLPPDQGPVHLMRMDWADFMGGTFAYLLSPAGAASLLRRASERGLQKAVDWFLMQHGEAIRAYQVAPAIVTSPCARSAGGADTDIQGDFKCLLQDRA